MPEVDALLRVVHHIQGSHSKGAYSSPGMGAREGKARSNRYSGWEYKEKRGDGARKTSVPLVSRNQPKKLNTCLTPNDFSLPFMPLVSHSDYGCQPTSDGRAPIYLFPLPWDNKCFLNEFPFSIVSFSSKDPYSQMVAWAMVLDQDCSNQLLASANSHSIYGTMWSVHILQLADTRKDGSMSVSVVFISDYEPRTPSQISTSRFCRQQVIAPLSPPCITSLTNLPVWLTWTELRDFITRPY